MNLEVLPRDVHYEVHILGLGDLSLLISYSSGAQVVDIACKSFSIEISHGTYMNFFYCTRIAKSLSSCSSTTSEIVSATERLKQELEHTTQRQDLITAFLNNYQLRPEEVTALREEDISENFFKALLRVQEIHANCKILLRTHHQRAGLELMDMMAVYQEAAYERLCRFVGFYLLLSIIEIILVLSIFCFIFQTFHVQVSLLVFCCLHDPFGFFSELLVSLIN